mgnify:FL=1|jgi:hypothetical protein
MSTHTDLRQAVDQQVNSLLEDYVKQLVEQQTFQIQEQITNRLDGIVGDVVDKVEVMLTAMNTKHDLKQTIGQKVNKLVETHAKQLVGEYTFQAQKQVRTRIDEVLEKVIRDTVENIDFAEGSIPPSSIDWSAFSISKQNVQGYRDLSSIEDFSNTVELTILDGAVVAENSLITNTITTEDITVNGNININEPAFNAISDRILSRVPAASAPKDYSPEINELSKRITKAESKPHSNFKELEVTGEAILSDVLYTTPGNKRVGINTMDPSDALTVWDNEVEVVVGKHKSQEGYIGTRRRQTVNIGANNKVGITVNSNGTVGIEDLQLMGRTISGGDNVPGHAARRGDIVLNNKVKQGDCIGWVCLDGLRWTGFGKVE